MKDLLGGDVYKRQAKMNLKTVRNYSLCFDKKLRVAHWVAYPLHASYIRCV